MLGGIELNIELIFSWLSHYEREFAESPHLEIGRLRKLLQKYLTGYDWK